MDITTYVNKGILFLNINGVFDRNTYYKFEKEIDYLLYKQGVSFFTINFKNASLTGDEMLSKIQNKLIEIFLRCGQVVMCGLNKLYQEKIGTEKAMLHYVNDEREVFDLITL